jgi:hypothetical protein
MLSPSLPDDISKVPSRTAYPSNSSATIFPLSAQLIGQQLLADFGDPDDVGPSQCLRTIAWRRVTAETVFPLKCLRDDLLPSNWIDARPQ